VRIPRLFSIIASVVLVLAPAPVFCAGGRVDEGSHGHLVKSTGLSGESALCMMTDHTGLKWIGTNSGINSFNGRECRSYGFSPSPSHKVNTHELCELPDGSILAATNAGIFSLHKGGSVFERVIPQVDRAEGILHSGGKTYLACRTGLNVYDGKSLSVVAVGSSPMGLENSVRDIIEGEDGKILFLSRYALNTYDPKDGSFTSIPLADRLSDGTAFVKMARCGRYIYIGTKNNGLYRFDSADSSIGKVEGVGNVITSMIPSGSNPEDICIGCDGGGAFMLDGATASVRESFSKESGFPLPTNAVYYYWRDSGGRDWFGFPRFGLMYSYGQRDLFKTFSKWGFSTEGLEVHSFCIGEREFLIGTDNGLFYVNEAGVKKHFSPEDLGGCHLVNGITSYGGKFFISSFDGGLRVLDPQNLSVGTLPNSTLLDNVTVTYMEPSPGGNLWIGSSEGLFILSPDGSVTRYTENNSGIKGGTVTGMRFTPSGNAWVATQQGLSMYVSSTSLFESANFPKDFFGNVTSLRICPSHEGYTLFYNPYEAFFSDDRMETFGPVEISPSLGESSVYSMLDDMKGGYWIATDEGLCCVDYDGTLTRFGYGEGLSNSVILSRLSMDSEGRIWVGSADGLFYSTPGDVKEWRSSPGCSVFTGYDKGEKAVLRWNFTSEPLCISPVLSDYSAGEGRIYECFVDGKKLDGVTRDGEELLVKGLSPGRHRVDVRLSGAEGTLSGVDVSVRPSALFYIEAAILLLALLALWKWNSYRKETNELISERDQIEDALVEAVMENSEASSDEGIVQSEDPQKYQKVRLDSEECERIVTRMKEIIEGEKVYLNPDLKMADLAERLSLSPSKLSQVFSLYIKENWYDYINAYRLSEFKRLISEGEHKRYTLLSLSERCGFKKSSFFSTFRKVEGMTPTEYLKKQG